MEFDCEEFEQFKKEFEKILVEIFPCHEQHKYHDYYEGEFNYHECNKCPTSEKSYMECELIKSKLYDFIDEINKRENTEYTLVKCLDVHKKGKKNKHIKRKPEMELVDVKNINNRMLIEAKSLHLDGNKIKNEASFKELSGYLESCISNSSDNNITNFFEENCCILYIDTDIDWGKNEKVLNYNYVYNEIINCINTNFHINEKIGKLYQEFFESKEVLNEKLMSKQFLEFCKSKIESCYDFTIGKINFTFGVCNELYNEEIKNGLMIRGKIREVLRYDKNKAFENIEKFLKQTQEKFKNCDEYIHKRKILIISNEAYYPNENVMELIKTFKLPQEIDEVWYSFYEKYECPKMIYRKVL
jgi:hypothetical protein